jgi:hypothetical protein
MKIVIDTNIFCRDYLMDGSAFRIFLSAVPRIGAKICIPGVVIEELVNRYERELRNLMGSFSKALRAWERFTGHLPGKFDVDVESEVMTYKNCVEKRLKELGAVVLPYPDISHHELVKRAISGRRPFTQNGRGYRDALIWETVLGLCRGGDSKIYIVTNNRRDFGEGPKPHDDLVLDLKDMGLNSDNVIIFPSLEQLNNDLIMPHLKRLDGMIERFYRDDIPEFSLSGWVEWNLKDVLLRDEWGAGLVGVDPWHISARVSSIKEIKSVNVDDVRQLLSGDILLTATAELEAEVSVHNDPENYYRYEDVRQLWGNEPPSEYSTAWVSVKAKVAFSLVLEKDSFGVLSEEIDSIDGDYCSIEVNPHASRLGNIKIDYD